jgi:hypothetical protein
LLQAAQSPSPPYPSPGREAALQHSLWRAKCGGKDFVCPTCNGESYYEILRLPEVRQCTACGRQARLRAGTIMERSKLSLVLWMRAVELVRADSSVSAVAFKEALGLSRYGTAWLLLFKIREATERYSGCEAAVVLTQGVPVVKKF